MENLRREKRTPGVQERRGGERKGKGNKDKKEKREAQVEQQGRVFFRGKRVKKGTQGRGRKRPRSFSAGDAGRRCFGRCLIVI